ncbi:hypothetical protein GLV98_12295 [Halobacillus litoralis]|uniref:Uncharacterized protein n=1 Tax=Halobacillus litoralis TaxID=45668 RepID=A0A845E7W8_9BACI|nr:hypothetical protein [Halobacillus litoralis]MYL50269.1 hypothetical protein [Halobacillus litoralis]
MIINSIDYQRFSLSILDQEFDVSDEKLISNLAVILRNDYPRRESSDRFYAGFNNEERRIFFLTKDSLMVKEDKVKEFQASLDSIINSTNELEEHLEFNRPFDLALRLVASAEIDSEIDILETSVNHLSPRGISIEDVPGDFLYSKTEFTFAVDGKTYTLEVEPDVENEYQLNLELNVLGLKIEDTSEISDIFSDSKSILEGLIKKIVGKW